MFHRVAENADRLVVGVAVNAAGAVAVVLVGEGEDLPGKHPRIVIPGVMGAWPPEKFVILADSLLLREAQDFYQRADNA